MNNFPQLNDLLPDINSLESINSVKMKALEAGYELLKILDTKSTEVKKFSIATAESLTGGLIMSLLVDIPYAGYLKYGCFGVYDTDAKRTFIGVSVDDVYTHKCASEMAIGVLKNSNAPLAIAVTGNARPFTDPSKLGEVFIGIAGYNENNEILFITKSINACLEEDSSFKSDCIQWYRDKQANNLKYSLTSDVSLKIRYYTAYAAFKLCKLFVEKTNIIVPNFINERIKNNTIINNEQDKIHINIPPNKYEFNTNGICINNLVFKNTYCNTTGKRHINHINIFKLNNNTTNRGHTRTNKQRSKKSNTSNKYKN